jgi:hypothetical protein
MNYLVFTCIYYMYVLPLKTQQNIGKLYLFWLLEHLFLELHSELYHNFRDIPCSLNTTCYSLAFNPTFSLVGTNENVLELITFDIIQSNHIYKGNISLERLGNSLKFSQEVNARMYPPTWLWSYLCDIIRPL